MLDREIMFMQLQELQRQKKLQELKDVHQQNAINQLSLVHNKQSSGTHYGLLNRGVQVRDASQMFMFGDTNFVQRSPNKFAYSQAQNQALQSSMDLASQHLAQFQESVFSQGLQFEGQTRKSQQVDNHNRCIELGGFQESRVENVGENQDLATLDPLEQKILFNMEDNSWGTSFGKFKSTENSGDFDSLHSGSWSGPMQSAVVEASNGDSGVQEEWSGWLSFQNPEHLNENQPSNMVESGKLQGPWLYNNLPEETTFINSDYSGMFGFMDRSAVSVKKEDGENWSTFEVKPGMGQQVTSSRRQSNIWVDVPAQQNRPSTSCAANKKTKTGIGEGSSKMHRHGNRGHAVVRNVEAFGISLNQAPKNYDPSIRAVIKKERVDYDYIVPQVTSLSHLNSACGNYKSQPIASSATDRSVKARTNKAALKRSSSIYLQHLDVTKENMVVLNSKKRKLSTLEQLPWHKEVTKGFTRLYDTSNAELEWAHSANRIPEKAADLHRIVDRKRRRLISTTQLMQLLFRPAPNIVLTEDATKHCDTITYYVAKFGLGDACRTSKRCGNQGLLKMVEGFSNRSKRVEDLLSRLEKGESSILDIKVEFQDLDKVSVINRFAMFHSRGPLVTTDTSSSSGASTMQKLSPQRHVTVSEMPSIVPEVRSCLSL